MRGKSHRMMHKVTSIPGFMLPSQQIPSPSATGSFRIHFADDTKVELSAATADEARKMAEERNSATITKIKRVRGSAHG